jgi:hypothetical protein
VGQAPAPTATSGDRPGRYRGVIETAMIVAALAGLFFLLPHELNGDDIQRLADIRQLLDRGRLSDDPYSLVMPLASAPVLLLSHLTESWTFWATRFNVLITAAGILIAYRLLRGRVDARLFRLTVLILLVASLYTNRMRDYNAEVFTATLVTIGIICLATNRHVILGWAAIVIGVVNIPASVVALMLLAIMQAARTRKLRHLLPVAAALALIMLEAWIRRGSPLDTGYGGNHGYRTIMPYSGEPGFSYPFVLGLAAILFSFGRGLLFFTPGLFMWLNSRVRALLPWRAAVGMMLLFTAGLVLIYASWWAWYGGIGWGPRFFAFAAIPASIIVAAGVRRAGRSARADLLTLTVLALSAWVGLAGAITDLNVDLGFCEGHGTFANEAYCWFAPDYSSLWQPIRQFPALTTGEWVLGAFFCVLYVYLAAPLVVSLIRSVRLPREWLSGWRV